VTNDVTPQVMLAALNDVWTRSAAAANTMRDQMANDHAEAFQLVKKGSIASVGKNSANQTFKSYGPASLTQVQIVEIIGNLIGLYDQIKSQLTDLFTASADFDYTVPAGFDFDPDIYAQMTKLFNAQSSGAAAVLPDISQLRVPFVPSVGPIGSMP
jgi:hypothetical protein